MDAKDDCGGQMMKTIISILAVAIKKCVVGKRSTQESHKLWKLVQLQPPLIMSAIIKTLTVILILCALPCFAWDVVYLYVPIKAHEADWRDALSARWNGKIEVVIQYGRIDVETKDYVIELDYLHKWHESFGQALHYAETGKQGVSALIVESK